MHRQTYKEVNALMSYCPVPSGVHCSPGLRTINSSAVFHNHPTLPESCCLNESRNSSTICYSLPRSKPCRNINCCSCPKNTQHSGLVLGMISWFCTAVDHCCLLDMPALQTSPLHPNSCFPCPPLPREPLPSSPTPLHRLFYKPQGSLSTFRPVSSTLSGSLAPTSLSHFPTLHFPYFSNSFHVSRIYIGQNLPESLATFGVKLYSQT